MITPQEQNILPQEPEDPNDAFFRALGDVLGRATARLMEDAMRTDGLERDQLRDRALPVIALALVSIDDNLGRLLDKIDNGQLGAPPPRHPPGLEPRT